LQKLALFAGEWKCLLLLLGFQGCAHFINAYEQLQFNSLPARTSILAAANPVGGHYNKAKTVSENLK